MQISKKFFTLFFNCVVSVAFLINCSSVFAQQYKDFPSHCKRGEYAYLNAHMSEVRPPSKKGYELIKTNKLLSICTDRQSEPFSMVAYRFGPVGNVELERISSEFKKFFIFERSTSPHIGENILFFRIGAYTYCVREILQNPERSLLEARKSWHPPRHEAKQP